MVTMFFTVSVVNNYALNLNIAMPLHMIFRSGSLIANMILGIIILKKRYSVFKYTSIALVSVGIFICTFMSAKQVTSQSSSSENDGFQAFAWWFLGIGALTFALLMSARMGIFQETLYKQFGKHSKEALFYNHALPLPGFIFLASDIYDHAVLFNNSELYQVPVVGVIVPIMWFYLLMNVITQYVCIRGVFILTTECASLTVTLVVTLRKFVRALEAVRLTSPSFCTQTEASPSALGSGCVLISRFGSQGLLSSPRVWCVYSTIWSYSLMGLQ
ncbi:nucleotide sugar transporter SLC35B4 isoform X3 [Sagmatias obliquidens]|nr:UDP-xylose and UDP-N-acetylglucosamine transporter isoform X3 [Lagenorhynchus obliquidens]